MKPGTITRGHPLFALLALLAGWIGGRVLNWEAPVAIRLGAAAAEVSAAARPVAPLQSLPPYLPASWAEPAPSYVYAAAPLPERRSQLVRPVVIPGQPTAPASFLPGAPAAWRVPHLSSDFALTESLPRILAPGSAVQPAIAAAPAPAPASARPRRWSIDAWALLRGDGMGGPVSPGVLPATYGASQAGGVLRYRLAPQSRHRPTAYIRTTATTGHWREMAAAIGVSARPVAWMPVIAALEGRVTRQGNRRRVQPAVMAITELPPFALPGRLRGEAYGQAGYVGGHFATPFADGMVRADRRLLALGAVEARVGGGVWGGVQKGAGRLDAGPSAMLAMPLGRGINGRVAVDWRFRLAGDAVPGSGPAVTLSAGF